MANHASDPPGETPPSPNAPGIPDTGTLLTPGLAAKYAATMAGIEELEKRGRLPVAGQTKEIISAEDILSAVRRIAGQNGLMVTVRLKSFTRDRDHIKTTKQNWKTKKDEEVTYDRVSCIMQMLATDGTGVLLAESPPIEAIDYTQNGPSLVIGKATKIVLAKAFLITAAEDEEELATAPSPMVPAANNRDSAGGIPVVVRPNNIATQGNLQALLSIGLTEDRDGSFAGLLSPAKLTKLQTASKQWATVTVAPEEQETNQ